MPSDVVTKKSAKPRVCVYTHLFPARSETFIREHVRGLSRLGYHVTVLARQPGADVSQWELSAIDAEGVKRVYLGNFTSFSTKVTGVLNRIRIVRLLIRHPRLLSVFRSRTPWSARELIIAAEAARYVANGGFDLVHVHFGHLAASLKLVGAAVGSIPPLVVTWHGYDVNAKPQLLGRSAYLDLFSSDAVHTVGSSFVKRKLVDLGARPDAVEIVPMGVDLDRFSYYERSGRENRQFEALRILSVGRLEEVKGHAWLVSAVEKLKKNGVAVSLRIVGEGPLRDALRGQIEAAGLGDCVHLLGARDTDGVAKEMREADLFALAGVETPSGKVEGQGVVFAEAQACGLPVVASRVGGIPESIIDGETGVLCPEKDVGAIATAISRFAKDRERCLEFGRRGRCFVEDRLSLDRMMERFEAIYGGIRSDA